MKRCRWAVPLLAALALVALSTPVAQGAERAAAGLTAVPVNVLANPSFETDANADGCPDEWGCTASGTRATATLDSTVTFNGVRSVKITVPSKSDRFVVQRWKKSAAQYVTYRFSAYYRALNVGPVGGFLRAHFHNASGAVIASKTAYGPGGTTAAWTPIMLDAPSPAQTAFLTLDLGVGSNTTGTVWFDAAFAEAYGSFHFWGGSQLVRATDTDTLTLQLSSNSAYAIDRVSAFGTVLTFRDCASMSTSTGATVRVAVTGMSCNLTGRRFNLPVGVTRAGTLTISGIRFSPPTGEPFVPILVHEATLNHDQAVWVMARNFGQPDYAAARAAQAWTKSLEVVERLSTYLDTLRTTDGAWKIAIPTQGSDVRPDPHAISAIVRGYLRLYQITGRADHLDRATRGLDWLVGRQSKPGDLGGAGSWGLPWSWGGAAGHFDHPGHYLPGSSSHPAHHGYAINTTNVGSALLEGYELTGKQEWLDAALRAKDYLLRGPYGLKTWTENGVAYGSIPYCNDRPIDEHGNRATQVYNIDGSALGFFTRLHQLTTDQALKQELETKGDLIARNLKRRVEPDASVAYAAYIPTYKPAGYAGIVYSGLFHWGQLRGDQSLVDKARQGLTWVAGVDRPSDITSALYANGFGLDVTRDIIGALERSAALQRSDGSYSDPASRATRTDAATFATQTGLLLQMGYGGAHPAPAGPALAPDEPIDLE